MPGLRKLLLLLIMLLLPLQGVAAAIMPMQKASGQAGAAMPCLEHLGHNAAQQLPHSKVMQSVDHSAPAGNDHDSDTTNHLCCHQVYTGTSSRAIASPAHKFFDVSRVVLPLATLFIPDSPDRPPRG